MAAPSGTSWGSAVSSGNSSARIGIYLSTSSSSTQVKASVQVWFWSRWGVDEHWGENTFRADWAASATTSRGGRAFQTSVSTGAGWSTSNQVQIASYSKTYTRTSSSQTGRFSAALTAIEAVGSSNVMSASVSFSIPANASYTVSFNANGGSGAPSSQTKRQGVTLKLSSTRPIRDGFVFMGWGTSSSDTTADYFPGSNYTANASITLYAIWQAEGDITQYVYLMYNNNGGYDGPSDQRVEKGKNTTVSSVIPNRLRHTFLGWSTDKEATQASYTSGNSITLSESMMLYGVWRLDDNTIKLYDTGRLEVVDLVESSELKISEGKLTCVTISESDSVKVKDNMNVIEIVEI